MGENNRHEKNIKILENFIESFPMEGICSAFVQPNSMGVNYYLIHLNVNGDWIRKQNDGANYLKQKFRYTLEKNVKNYTGIDVSVTSSITNCGEQDNLSESMSPHVKRRITNKELLHQLTTILDYEVNITSFDNSSDAVEEIIDLLNERILDEIYELTNRQVSLKEKDELYWYLTSKFSELITNLYNEEKESLNETNKNYIVTESQYSLILESQQYIEFFQDFIDSKMGYIRRVCDMGADDFQGDVGDESCKQIEEIEKVKVIDADWIKVKHSNRETEETYMSVRIMVYYSSIRRGDFDADDLTYDLERMIRKSTGMPFILNYQSTNTNTQFDW